MDADQITAAGDGECQAPVTTVAASDPPNPEDNATEASKPRRKFLTPKRCVRVSEQPEKTNFVRVKKRKIVEDSLSRWPTYMTVWEKHVRGGNYKSKSDYYAPTLRKEKLGPTLFDMPDAPTPSARPPRASKTRAKLRTALLDWSSHEEENEKLVLNPVGITTRAERDGTATHAGKGDRQQCRRDVWWD